MRTARRGSPVKSPSLLPFIGIGRVSDRAAAHSPPHGTAACLGHGRQSGGSEVAVPGSIPDHAQIRSGSTRDRPHVADASLVDDVACATVPQGWSTDCVSNATCVAILFPPLRTGEDLVPPPCATESRTRGHYHSSCFCVFRNTTYSGRSLGPGHFCRLSASSATAPSPVLPSVGRSAMVASRCLCWRRLRRALEYRRRSRDHSWLHMRSPCSSARTAWVGSRAARCEASRRAAQPPRQSKHHLESPISGQPRNV